MVAADCRDDFRPTGCTLGKFQCGLDGFGARIGEKRVLQVAGSEAAKFFGQVGRRFAEKHFATQWHLVELGFYGFYNLRMPVAQAEHAIPTQAIKIFAALVVPNVASFRTYFNAESSKVHQLTKIRVYKFGVIRNDLGVQFFGRHTRKDTG